MINQNNVKFSTVNAHLAHTCGNIAAIVTQEFKSKFPKDYFKNTHKSTYIALRQFRNIKNEIDFKWQKPFVTIQPKLLSEKTDGNVDMWRRLYDTSIYDLTRPDYHNVKFFKDSERGVIIDFSVERMKMGFSFNVVVSNEYQQYNVLGHMNTAFNCGNPYYRDVILETIIPNSIIQQLSKVTGIPIKDENGSVKPFLMYVNKYSNIPITLKIDPATGKNLFHMLIRSSIFQAYDELNIDSGDQVNMTMESFPISLQLMCEFNYPSSFYFISTKDENDILPSQDMVEDTGDGTYNLFYTMQHTVIPQYNKRGKHLSISVTFDIENEEVDTIDISSLLKQDELDLLDIELNNNGYVSGDIIKLFDAEVYDNDDPLTTNDYYVDWRERKLYIKNGNLLDTYRLALYIDQNMINKYITYKSEE